MTTKTDTQSILTEMQAALARQAGEIQALREQNQRLESSGAAQDSLKQAIREFDASRRVQVAGQRMVGPCVREKGGVVCGRAWEEHCSEDGVAPARIRDHTYKERIIPHPEKRKPRSFYAKEAVVEVKSVEDDEAYLSVAEAAKMLSVEASEVRQMIADGGLKGLKVGRSVIVRKSGVDRILALAEMSEV